MATVLPTDDTQPETQVGFQETQVIDLDADDDEIEDEMSPLKAKRLKMD